MTIFSESTNLGKVHGKSFSLRLWRNSCKFIYDCHILLVWVTHEKFKLEGWIKKLFIIKPRANTHCPFRKVTRSSCFFLQYHFQNKLFMQWKGSLQGLPCRCILLNYEVGVLAKLTLKWPQIRKLYFWSLSGEVVLRNFLHSELFNGEQITPAFRIYPNFHWRTLWAESVIDPRYLSVCMWRRKTPTFKCRGDLCSTNVFWHYPAMTQLSKIKSPFFPEIVKTRDLGLAYCG